MSNPRQKAFEEIYEGHSWGGGSRSGPGSDPEHTSAYVDFVNAWLKQHRECKSIVELGCGDWATSRRIEFQPEHSYVGFDIVPGVIENNRKAYGSANIRFECNDFILERPPSADLLLIKDVLQHLSNDSVQQFVQSTLPRFRFAILTNDVLKYEEVRRYGLINEKRHVQHPNSDIADGKSRPLRLDLPPFNLKYIEKRGYIVKLPMGTYRSVFEKDILVWQQRGHANGGH